MYHMILDPIAALPPGGVARFGELRLLLKWLYEESKKKRNFVEPKSENVFLLLLFLCVCL